MGYIWNVGQIELADGLDVECAKKEKRKESFGLSRENGVYYKGHVVWGREGARNQCWLRIC